MSVNRGSLHILLNNFGRVGAAPSQRRPSTRELKTPKDPGWDGTLRPMSERQVMMHLRHLAHVGSRESETAR